MANLDVLQARATALRLHGLLAHWPEAVEAGWVNTLLDWEETERARRSLERRLQDAHIGRFKSLCDFDWSWPKRCDRAAFEALMTLDFLKEAANAVLVGPNGVGKTTLARNLAYQALIHGLDRALHHRRQSARRTRRSRRRRPLAPAAAPLRCARPARHR